MISTLPLRRCCLPDSGLRGRARISKNGWEGRTGVARFGFTRQFYSKSGQRGLPTPREAQQRPPQAAISSPAVLASGRIPDAAPGSQHLTLTGAGPATLLRS